MECDTCRAKAGSPILCQGCLHNRELISNLRGLEERIELLEKRQFYQLIIQPAPANPIPPNYYWPAQTWPNSFKCGKCGSTDNPHICC